MSHKTVEKSALFLIAAASIIGVIALARGHWIVVASMVLIILGQGLAFRRARVAGVQGLKKPA
jgi:hypothetical protein